jgi:hypothetical protein
MNNTISSRLIYPNPFQPTGIEFTLEEEAQITVKILDSSGQEIKTLIDSQAYFAGTHVIPLELVKNKTGEYWYQITINIGEKRIIETRQIR